MSLDEGYLKAMAKLDDGFALADRIVRAARGGPERPELCDMIEMVGNDADLAVAVVARLTSYVAGSTPEQMASAMSAANIPAVLDSTPPVTTSGLILP